MYVITGASDGLGKSLAQQLESKGKRVISFSRRKAKVETIICDLTDPKSVKEAAFKVLDEQEPIDALINCAGIFSMQELGNLESSELERVFATNVTGPMQLTSLLIGRIKKDEADILNVSSSVGTKAYENQAAYGASKWAMRGFSANLQVELKGTPCRVISFCPGGFKSKLFEKAIGFDNTTDDSAWMKAEDI